VVREEELHNLYVSPNIRVIKSKGTRWVGHEACMGETKKYAKFRSGNLKGRDHAEDEGVNGRMLEWFLGK
jgi:hypothetical protein